MVLRDKSFAFDVKVSRLTRKNRSFFALIMTGNLGLGEIWGVRVSILTSDIANYDIDAPNRIIHLYLRFLLDDGEPVDVCNRIKCQFKAILNCKVQSVEIT